MLRWSLFALMSGCGLFSGDDGTDPPGAEPTETPGSPLPPTVSFVAPVDGDEVEADAALRIEIAVTDPDTEDLQTLTLTWAGDYASEAPAAPDSSGRAVFFPGDLSPGAASLTVTARDADGLTSTAAIAFTVLAPPVDADNDGFTSDVDCNDLDDTIFPGAPEVCDGVDQDCDETVDEGVTVTYHADTDNDGFGDPLTPTEACTPPPGHVTDGTDCDDSLGSVYPGADEICDGIDQDCDTVADNGVTSTFYADSDNDGFGDSLVTTQACTAPLGFVADATDCNDAVGSIFPGAPEQCDGVDQSCDGVPDDGVTTTYYEDSDSDGFGNPAVTLEACSQPSGWAPFPNDCDDTTSSVTLGQISSRDPAPGAVDVALGAVITVELDSPDPNGVVSLVGPGGPVSGVSTSVNDTLSFVPDADLDPNRVYVVNVDWQCGTDQWTFSTETLPTGVNPQQLLGRAYRLELDQGTVVQPTGTGTVLSTLLSGSEVLLGAVQSSPPLLDLRIAGAGFFQTQDLCEETFDTTVDFSTNPSFELLAPSIVLGVAGTSLPFEDLVLTGTFDLTLDSVTASFDGRLDTRDWATLNTGSPLGVCVGLVPFGVGCVACDDGQPVCLDIQIVDVPGQSEPTPLVERTPVDIANDPNCP